MIQATRKNGVESQVLGGCKCFAAVLSHAGKCGAGSGIECAVVVFFFGRRWQFSLVILSDWFVYFGFFYEFREL